MTVPGSELDRRGKGRVTGIKDGGDRRTPRDGHTEAPSPWNGVTNPAPAAAPRMTSAVLPAAAPPSLKQSMLVASRDPHKDAPKRAASVPRSYSQHSAGQGSLYHQMAAQARAQVLAAASKLSSSSSMRDSVEDQPLDLSRKASRPRSVSDPPKKEGTAGEGVKGLDLGNGLSSLGSLQGLGGNSNGLSSLESLQKRFGGDFLLGAPSLSLGGRGVGGSNIPLQSTILPPSTSASILRPPLLPPLSGVNGLSHLSISAAAAAAAATASASYNNHNHHHHRQHHQAHHHHHRHNNNHHHHHSLPAKSKPWEGKGGDGAGKESPITPTTTTTTAAIKSSGTYGTTSAAAKKGEKPSDHTEPHRKTTTTTTTMTTTDVSKKSGSTGGGSGGGASGGGGGDGGVVEEGGEEGNKHTMHRCSCQRMFGTLYALSAHLRETGHTPGAARHTSLMDYPKLVRGQDMWLNQESEQTRRILRCMQCGESFRSLPMLTVHMMKTQHYSKIVSAEHGRRAHKCSAYCDRDTDQECIFKCKVCQDTFTDMEGLANHMVMSGHHKKQNSRASKSCSLLTPHPHPHPHTHSHQRKRRLSSSSSSDPADIAWASLLEYKHKHRRHSGEGFNGFAPHTKDAEAPTGDGEGSVGCDSCGKRVERSLFLEHVQSCSPTLGGQKDADADMKGKVCDGEDDGDDDDDTLTRPSESTASSHSCRESPSGVEQPLPHSRDTGFLRCVNSMCSASPEREKDDGGRELDREQDREQDGEDRGQDLKDREQEGEDSPPHPQPHRDHADHKPRRADQSPNAGDTEKPKDEQDVKDGDDGHRVESKDVNSDPPPPPPKTPEAQSSKSEDAASPDENTDDAPNEVEEGKLPVHTAASAVPESDEGQHPAETPAFEESSDNSSTAHNGVKERPESGRKSSVSDSVPSPMITGVVRSEEPSLSPHSTHSHCDSSPPHSPSLASPPSPSHQTPPPPLAVSTSPQPGLKRQPVGSQDLASQRQHKKMKLEEDPRLGDQKAVYDSDMVKNIKKEPSDDDDDDEDDGHDSLKKSPRKELGDEDIFNRSPKRSCERPQNEAKPEEVSKKSLSQRSRPNGSNGQPDPSKKSRSSRPDIGLDIIDPNSQTDTADSSNSALRAMESFIQRSFSAKFDSRRSCLSAGFAFGTPAPRPPLIHGSRMAVPGSSSPSPSSSSVSYQPPLSKLSSAQSPSSMYVDSGDPLPLPSSPDRSALSSLAAKSAELLEKTRNNNMMSTSACSTAGIPSKPSGDTSSRDTFPDPTVVKHRSVTKEDREEERRAEKRKARSPEGKNGLKEEHMVMKYLNLEEEGGTEDRRTKEGERGASGGKMRSGKQSALDSLSSFVYGQPMTSEHPLDSLQKLLTKSSLPRMLSSAGPRPFPPFTHHPQPYLMEQQLMEWMCFTPPQRPASQSALPLNLSMKPGDEGGGAGDNTDRLPDCDSPSTSCELDEEGGASSPGGGGLKPEGDMVEYKCTACSRSFASKGSYRYHLSRCHLSTVKKYGIKEAFNMSPYIYMPLDHTAKFSKYYHMAQELAARKGSSVDEH